MIPIQAPVASRPRAVALLATIASIAALHLGRGILAPLALAGLLAFLLTPISSRIERLRVGRGIAAAVAVLVLMAAVAGPVYVVAHEGIALSRELPAYRENIQRKLAMLETSSLTEPLRAATEGVPEVAAPGAAPRQAPIVVRIEEPKRGAWDALSAILGPLAPLLAGTLIVLLVTTLLIASRSEIRERFVRLVSRGELAVTTQALDEASGRVARFLAASLLVNAMFAVPTTLCLLAIGVPNAVLWGLLAGLLRFVPIVGVWIAALFPLATVFAVYDDWWRLGAILGVFGITDLLVSNVAEPLIFGRRTGIAPFAVVLSTLFWTWLWGVNGLLLAMPLTVCLAVAGRHVPGMGFLDVLLGAASALSPAQRFYQSMLMFDPVRAGRQLEEAVKQDGLDPALDTVVLPALALASEDRRRGSLEQEVFQQLCSSVRDIVDALDAPPPAEAASKDAAPVEGNGVASPPAPPRDLPPTLIVPVTDAADAAAADILASRLSTLGVVSEVATISALGGEIAALVARLHPPLVVLVGLPPLADGRMRYLAKRLRGCVPAGQLLGLAWQLPGATDEAQRAMSEAADQTVRDMTHATQRIRSFLNESQQRLELAPSEETGEPLALAKQAS